MTEEQRQPISRREWIGIAGVVALFLYLRFPLWRGDALLLGWNSDAGVFGLMARRIREGTFQIFFWGQSYMGTLTSFVAAAIGVVLGNVGPLALRLAASAVVLAGILFYWLGLRRAFDRGTALMVAAWLAAGPWYLFHFTVAPIGAEQAFFLGGLAFWFVTRNELRTRRDWLLFGLLSGFTWWINQSAVFVIGAALLVAIAESEWWSRVRPLLRPIDRVLVRETSLQWRPISPSFALVLRGFSLLLMFLTVLGALRSAGAPVPALFLHSPIAEPLTALVIFHAILELILGRSWRRAAPTRELFAAGGSFAIGFVVAYLPVIIGGIRGVYPRTYGLSAPVILLESIPGRLATIVRADWWQFLGADATPLGITIGVVIMALLVWGRASARPARAEARATSIAFVTVVLALIFFAFSGRAREGAVRYIVVALPCVYAFAARAAGRTRLGAAAVLVVLIALTSGRALDARAVAAGEREHYANLPGGFDPRPPIAAIERSGYRVCYADYWIAYKLQWITEERVRFIVSHGYTRNRPEAALLLRQPGVKCYVDYEGNVSAGPPLRRPVPRASVAR